ncbi:MAG: vitamin K epoxide reductase family protein [Candidatus Dormibacteraceae bacterium]
MAQRAAKGSGKRTAKAARAAARRGDRAVLLALVAIAALGLGLSIYLTTVHYAGTQLACTVTSFVNCNTVTHSPESLVFGTQLPITVPGMIWFAVSGALAVWALLGREPRWLAPLQLLWGVAALLFVFYLVYAELAIIHQLCEWCTGVHLLILASVLLAVRRMQTREPG